ncbi:hypothetical protein [Streptomyces sp. NPDC046805]|uniref:hypothetical protein n=1 Tax=Streptomyces sp. NPDC046805 TaxID=3155134 RepID=UPI0033CCF6BE
MTTPTPSTGRPPRPRRALRTRTQRRAAAGHFVRGLAYGTGLAATSLLSYWIEKHL